MQTIIFIIGPSCAGKTTIGKLISQKYNLKFIDADTFHSKKNIKKMTKGISLKDEDRVVWLRKINREACLNKKTLIISCSALKTKYRKILKRNINTKFFYLKAPLKILKKRAKNRRHFMNNKLIKKQYITFEGSNNIVTISNLKKTQIIKRIIFYLDEIFFKD